MRAAFATTLMELAARDPRVLLLTADLGYMALEPFAEKFPDRFFNVGVAEQNMIGVATGLASFIRLSRLPCCGLTNSSATARFNIVCPCGSSALGAAWSTEPMG